MALQRYPNADEQKILSDALRKSMRKLAKQASKAKISEATEFGEYAAEQIERQSGDLPRRMC